MFLLHHEDVLPSTVIDSPFTLPHDAIPRNPRLYYKQVDQSGL